MWIKSKTGKKFGFENKDFPYNGDISCLINYLGNGNISSTKKCNYFYFHKLGLEFEGHIIELLCKNASFVFWRDNVETMSRPFGTTVPSSVPVVPKRLHIVSTLSRRGTKKHFFLHRNYINLLNSFNHIVIAYNWAVLSVPNFVLVKHRIDSLYLNSDIKDQFTSFHTFLRQ